MFYFQLIFNTMTTPKFTPGPWVFREGCTPHFQSLVYAENTGEDIAICYSDETGANAALIAAAPEMWGLLSRVAAGEDVRNEAERLLNQLTP